MSIPPTTPQKPVGPDLAALGEALHADPKLRQAALAGMASSISQHVTAGGGRVSPSVMAGLGKLKQAGVGGGAVEDNYVVRGASDVFAVVKIRPAGAGEEIAG